MKTKLLTICFFLFTSQVFAHDAGSGYKQDSPWAIAEEEGTATWHEHLLNLKGFSFKCKDDITVGLRYENRKYRMGNFTPEKKISFYLRSGMPGIIRYKERTHTNCSDLKNPGPDCRYIEKHWRANMERGSSFDNFSCIYISTIKMFDCHNYTAHHPDGRDGYKKFRLNINTNEFMYSAMGFQEYESKDNRNDAFISSGFCFRQ